MKRNLAFVAGMTCLGFVIWLYFRAQADSSLLALFGLATAFFVPLGFSLIGSALFPSPKNVLSQLAKVPEINELMAKAKSQEEQIQLLQKQREQLVEIIRREAIRRGLELRKEALEQDAVRILNDLRVVRNQLEELRIESEEHVVEKELQLLEERIKAVKGGDFVIHFGNRYVIVPKELFRSLPFPVLGGEFGYQGFKLLANLLQEMRREKTQKIQSKAGETEQKEGQTSL